MNRKIREYATCLKYTLDGDEKTETYHQVSMEQAMDSVEKRVDYASDLGADDIICEVVFCESTIH